MEIRYYLVKNRPSRRGGLLIGEHYLDFGFHFNRPSLRETGGRELNTFEQWRDLLKEVTETGEHVIVNQYDEIMPYGDFIEMVEEAYIYKTIGE